MIKKIKGENGVTYLNFLGITYRKDFIYFCLGRYGVYFYYFKKPMCIIKWDK